jgi:nucleoside-diphosphate-sugar epimerase
MRHFTLWQAEGKGMASCLITGATGFVGSHLAETCAARGWAVRALARAGSNTQALERLGVRVVRGDLQGIGPPPEALDGVEVVFHCAARVGDWGPVEEFRAVNVGGLHALLEACKGRPLTRFVHFSSLGVYAARHHHGTDESEPLPTRHIDGYTQSKVEAEALALSYHRQHDVPMIVLRPGFIYGPRDRTVLPKLVENLRKGLVRYLGSGNQALNTIYVGNLVEAALLAVEKGVVGRVYNLTDGEAVSKRRFIEAVADGLDLPRPRRKVPLWLARLGASLMERTARLSGAAEPPQLTQARLKFLGLNLDFSIDRARRELGYAPQYSFDDGLATTLGWYRETLQDRPRCQPMGGAHGPDCPSLAARRAV